MKKFIIGLLALLLVFQLEINYVFLSASVFLIYYALRKLNDGILISQDKIGPAIVFGLYIYWVTFSHVSYSMQYDGASARNISQYLGNFIYLVFIIPIILRKDVFEKFIILFSMVYSVVVVFVFLVSGLSVESYADSAIPEKYFPGWPNGFVIPLIAALYFAFDNKYKYRALIFAIIFTALVLSGSRISIFSAILVVMMNIIINNQKLYVGALITSGLIIYILLGDLDEFNSVIVIWDRVDIFRTAFSYISERPLIGYGGNTIDQLQHIYIEHEPIKNWGHTHNLLLETSLRYGLVGSLLFFIYIYMIIRTVKNKKDKLFLYLMVAMAFFQTYMRDANFVIIFMYFIVRSEWIFSRGGMEKSTHYQA